MEKEISTNIVSQKNDSSGDFNEKIKIQNQLQQGSSKKSNPYMNEEVEIRNQFDIGNNFELNQVTQNFVNRQNENGISISHNGNQQDLPPKHPLGELPSQNYFGLFTNIAVTNEFIHNDISSGVQNIVDLDFWNIEQNPRQQNFRDFEQKDFKKQQEQYFQQAEYKNTIDARRQEKKKAKNRTKKIKNSSKQEKTKSEKNANRSLKKSDSIGEAPQEKGQGRGRGQGQGKPRQGYRVCQKKDFFQSKQKNIIKQRKERYIIEKCQDRQSQFNHGFKVQRQANLMNLKMLNMPKPNCQSMKRRPGPPPSIVQDDSEDEHQITQEDLFVKVISVSVGGQNVKIATYKVPWMFQKTSKERISIFLKQFKKGNPALNQDLVDVKILQGQQLKPGVIFQIGEIGDIGPPNKKVERKCKLINEDVQASSEIEVLKFGKEYDPKPIMIKEQEIIQEEGNNFQNTPQKTNQDLLQINPILPSPTKLFKSPPPFLIEYCSQFPQVSEHERDGVPKTKRKYKPKVKNNRNTEPTPQMNQNPNPLDNAHTTPTPLTLSNTNNIESKTERDRKREIFLECWDYEGDHFINGCDHNVGHRGQWEEEGGFGEEESKREEERKEIIEKIQNGEQGEFGISDQVRSRIQRNGINKRMRNIQEIYLRNQNNNKENLFEQEDSIKVQEASFNEYDEKINDEWKFSNFCKEIENYNIDIEITPPKNQQLQLSSKQEEITGKEQTPEIKQQKIAVKNSDNSIFDCVDFYGYQRYRQNAERPLDLQYMHQIYGNKFSPYQLRLLKALDDPLELYIWPRIHIRLPESTRNHHFIRNLTFHLYAVMFGKGPMRIGEIFQGILLTGEWVEPAQRNNVKKRVYDILNTLREIQFLQTQNDLSKSHKPMKKNRRYSLNPKKFAHSSIQKAQIVGLVKDYESVVQMKKNLMKQMETYIFRQKNVRRCIQRKRLNLKVEERDPMELLQRVDDKEDIVLKQFYSRNFSRIIYKNSENITKTVSEGELAVILNKNCKKKKDSKPKMIKEEAIQMGNQQFYPAYNYNYLDDDLNEFLYPGMFFNEIQQKINTQNEKKTELNNQPKSDSPKVKGVYEQQSQESLDYAYEQQQQQVEGEREFVYNYDYPVPQPQANNNQHDDEYLL